MSLQGTSTWNRHRGVGATLLENWVEERAVGDLILEERADLPTLSRQGHQVSYSYLVFIFCNFFLIFFKDLLTHSKAETSFHTTHQDDFAVLNKSKRIIGKRRQLLELELMKKAL